MSGGDRGLGPILAAHPELVHEVSIDGSNPDVDTRDDLAALAELAWADRVRANREQVDRVREVPDGTDFYAPVRSMFRADPTRVDDPVLARLLAIVRAGDTWLDVGAGAGRFALPIARALEPSGGSVVALDASASMLEAAREIAVEYGIANVRTIEARWPPDEAVAADVGTAFADVVLIAHVGYDVEAIGPFVDALESAARRELVAVLMEQMPASAADAFWPPVHGETRAALPALADFIELLVARGHRPSVERVTDERRRFESRDAVETFVRRQLWIARGRSEGGTLPGRPVGPGGPGWRWVDDPGSRPGRHRDRPLGIPSEGGGTVDLTLEEIAPDGRPMIDPSDRAGWRAWLAANHTRPDGIWVVMDRRGTNPTQVDYESAVEEALCFGWIDSKVVKLDAGRTLQWFSPRRPRGTWARTNKVRVERLTAEGLMMPAGLAVIEEAKRNGSVDASSTMSRTWSCRRTWQPRSSRCRRLARTGTRSVARQGAPSWSGSSRRSARRHAPPGWPRPPGERPPTRRRTSRTRRRDALDATIGGIRASVSRRAIPVLRRRDLPARSRSGSDPFPLHPDPPPARSDLTRGALMTALRPTVGVLSVLMLGLVAACGTVTPSLDPTAPPSDPHGVEAGSAIWWVSPDAIPLAPETTSVPGFVMETACASGQSPKDA